MSTVIISNCSQVLLERLQIEIHGPESLEMMIQRSSRGETMAIKTSEPVESFLKGRIAHKSSGSASAEVIQLTAAVEQLNGFCSELKMKQTFLTKRCTALMNQLMNRSQILPRIITDCEESKTQIADYRLGEQIGEGTTGNIYACNHKDSPSQVFAVKIFDKKQLCSVQAFEALEIEIASMRRLKSDHIVSLVDVLQTENNFYLFMERAQTDLFEYLQYFPDGVSLPIAKSIGKQILQALKLCHVNGVTHRDLKPENILLNVEVDAKNKSHSLCVKLADFGTAGMNVENKFNVNQGCVGSIGYLAPETASKVAYDGAKIDIWGFGCILIELLFGSKDFQSMWLDCFSGITSTNSTQEIQRASIKALENLKTFISKKNGLNQHTIGMIESCLQPNPILRLNATNLLHHKWFE